MKFYKEAIEPSIAANTPKTHSDAKQTSEVTNKIIPKKRPNYQLFKANNWKKIELQ